MNQELDRKVGPGGHWNQGGGVQEGTGAEKVRPLDSPAQVLGCLEHQAGGPQKDPGIKKAASGESRLGFSTPTLKINNYC